MGRFCSGMGRCFRFDVCFSFFLYFFCGISVRSVETMFVYGRDCTRSE